MSIRWPCGAPVVLGLFMATGCSIIDPYVKSPGAKLRQECKSVKDEATLGASNAFDYARCVRDDMDDRAGDYGTMNNGGSALLLSLAGLTAYRSFRGNNEANTQALATGGATLYATQKYLYRKPREVIYATGSATIDCGIGITMRRLQVSGDSLNTKTTEATNALHAARLEREKAIGLSNGAQPNSECPVSTRQLWSGAEAHLSLAEATLAGPMENRLDAIRLRADRLTIGAETAHIDLITLTKNVRGIVNRQLALEQPDPGEISASIGMLTLPQATPKSSEQPTNGSKNTPSPAGRRPATKGVDPRTAACNITQDTAQDFAKSAQNAVTKARDTENRIRLLEAHLNLIEADSNGALDAHQLQRACAFHGPNATAPFDIKPTETPQTLIAGERVLVPITGGVSPFVANVATAPTTGTLRVSAKLLEDGRYAFEASASGNATPGTYLIVSNDDAGAGRSFQLQIVAPQNSTKEN